MNLIFTRTLKNWIYTFILFAVFNVSPLSFHPNSCPGTSCYWCSPQLLSGCDLPQAANPRFRSSFSPQAPVFLLHTLPPNPRPGQNSLLPSCSWLGSCFSCINMRVVSCSKIDEVPMKPRSILLLVAVAASGLVYLSCKSCFNPFLLQLRISWLWINSKSRSAEYGKTLGAYPNMGRLWERIYQPSHHQEDLKFSMYSERWNIYFVV